jgi:hypothetical protein
LVPDFAIVGPDFSIDLDCKLVSAGMKLTVDKSVSEEEVLGLFGRFKSLHLPLLSSRRPMRVLVSIVQISALPMLDARKQLTLSDAMLRSLSVTITRGRYWGKLKIRAKSGHKPKSHFGALCPRT